MYSELEELNKAYYDIKAQREQFKTEAMKPGAGNTNSAYAYARLQADENQAKQAFDTASEEYLKTQKDVLDKMSDSLNTSLTKFKTIIGQEAYDTFMSRNKATYDELQSLFTYNFYISSAHLAKIKELLGTLNKEFVAELKRLSSIKKSSGF